MGFSNSKRLVTCMLLMVAVENAVGQPFEDSPWAASGHESRLTRLETNVKGIQVHLDKSLVAADCTIILASFGYNDSAKYAYVKTTGFSKVLTKKQIDNRRGLTLYELDPKTCTTKNRMHFDTYESVADRVWLSETLELAQEDTIIVGVTADTVENEEQLAFQTYVGSFFDYYNMNITGLKARDKFAFILQIGYPRKTKFQRKPCLEGNLVMVIELHGSTVKDVTFEKSVRIL